VLLLLALAALAQAVALAGARQFLGVKDGQAAPPP